MTMKQIIGIALIVVIVVTAFTIIQHILEDPEDFIEETEQEKTYRALRHLIYLITGIIITGIVVKVFFWTAILSII